MNLNASSKKYNKQGFLRGVFILFVALECVLIGMLIMGNVLSTQTFSHPLSVKEVNYYNQYTILLPNEEGRNAGAADILALCTFQEEKMIGDDRYTFYTSEVLPQYIHRCSGIREIMETSGGTVYVTYISQDAEDVILTIDNGGIIQKDIYDGKTDTYYVLSPLEHHKISHYRHQRSDVQLIEMLVGCIGLCVVFFFFLHTTRRHKKEPWPDKSQGQRRP